MTAQELIELLEDLDPETEVRIAHQPSWPFEYALSGAVATNADDGDGFDAPVVWLGEAQQIGYLPEGAATQLGW